MRIDRLFASFVVAAAALLSGCAATGPVFSPAPEPGPEAALVYVYRSNTTILGARDAYFYVDDINVADLSMNGYTWFHAPPGNHVLKQKWPPDVNPFHRIEIPVNWEAGKTYFYRFYATGQFTTPNTIGVSNDFRELQREVALKDIAGHKYQPAAGVAKLKESAGKTR